MFISRLYVLNLDEISMDEKIRRVEDLIKVMEKKREAIENIDAELHAIDKVMCNVMREKNLTYQDIAYKKDEQIKALSDKATELLKEKEIVWPEIVEADEALHTVIISIREEVGEANWWKDAEEKNPGIMKRYEEVYDFMEDIYDVIDKK